ncbi:MAG: MFS transporter, partial [Thermococcus sp.]
MLGNYEPSQTLPAPDGADAHRLHRKPLVIYYLSKGLSYAQIGLATALTAWGIVLLEVSTGIVGDRVSRKLSVLIGLTLNAIATLVLIFLNGFSMLLLYALLMALSVAFVSGSLQAWLFDTM